MIDANKRAVADLITGFMAPRIWLMLSWNDLEARYRRTILGPFWQVLSLAGWIGGITVIFSTIRYRADPNFLEYAAAGIVAYSFIASLLNEPASAYQRGDVILKAYDLPASIHVFRSVASQFIMLGHSLSIFVLVAVYTETWPTAASLLIIPTLLLFFAMGTGWALVISLLGARFRDVGPALSTVLSFMYLMTPVFWRRESLGDRTYIADWNPLYHMVELLRAPMLGHAAEPISWIVVGCATVASLGIGTFAFIKYRRLVSYWI